MRCFKPLPRLARGPPSQRQCRDFLASSPPRGKKDHDDPRIRDLGHQISDDYARIRDHYATPKYPLVLAHGLFGFSELALPGPLGTVSYWHGIAPAFAANSIRHVATAVPPSHSIEDRAEALARGIREQFAAHDGKDQGGGRGGGGISSSTPVNIVAHSMGGLDARYMISCLRPKDIDVRSLVTVATPHRGSAFADYVLGGLYEKDPQKNGLDGKGKEIGSERAAAAAADTEGKDEGNHHHHHPYHRDDKPGGWWDLRNLYGTLERLGLGTAAFSQLTPSHMAAFNESCPDDPSVRYFSYGAALRVPPPLLSPFRLPHRVIRDAEGEGPNDGLVSVASSRWGTYKGTLEGVGHLDLINWSNRARWAVRRWMGKEKGFNAVAFYLAIADMLAKEGL